MDTFYGWFRSGDVFRCPSGQHYTGTMCIYNIKYKIYKINVHQPSNEVSILYVQWCSKFWILWNDTFIRDKNYCFFFITDAWTVGIMPVSNLVIRVQVYYLLLICLLDKHTNWYLSPILTKMNQNFCLNFMCGLIFYYVDKNYNINSIN